MSEAITSKKLEREGLVVLCVVAGVISYHLAVGHSRSDFEHMDLGAAVGAGALDIGDSLGHFPGQVVLEILITHL